MNIDCINEIGGYFELESLIKKEYYNNMLRLSSGRNALLYLIRVNKIESLRVPYYVCDSILNLCRNYQIHYTFYHINEQFEPINLLPLQKSESLFIINYFGQLEGRIDKLKKKYKNIIVDNTQAFFQKPIKGIDTIYSCRKFFGVPDGAYVSKTSKRELDLPFDNSNGRMQHLIGRLEGKASDYYFEYVKNEQAIEKLELSKMSKTTFNLLGAIDYGQVVEKRNRNFDFLHESLKDINILKVRFNQGAFAYPFYCNNGNRIRQELIEQKIYIPILWENVLTLLEKQSIEYRYSLNILPLPCDQRYNIKDMERIVCIILEQI